MAAVDRSRGTVYRDGKPVPQCRPIFDALARRRFKAVADTLVYVGGAALVAVLLWPDLIGPIVAWWSR